MNELKFYKNTATYPDYSEAIAQVGVTKQVTPRNMDYKSGYIDVDMSFTDVMSCNYLSIKRDNGLVYGWIMNVEEKAGDRLYRVFYTVDAFRTFKGKINYLSQWVMRDMNPTELKDSLLSSVQPYMDIKRQGFNFDDAGWRTLIIQVRDQEGTATSYTTTPVQPSPYKIYMRKYATNGWAMIGALYELMYELGNSAQTSNIVTIFSAPGKLYEGTESSSLQLKFANDSDWSIGNWTDGANIAGFYKYEGFVTQLKKSTPIVFEPEMLTREILKVDHSVSLVTPDAGMIAIPDEMLFKDGLSLVRYVDIYSGSVNYMVEAPNLGKTSPMNPVNISIRAGGTPSIPVLSNPMDTYLSQNQSALVTSLLGDVAMIGAGAVGVLSGAVTGGVGVGLGAPAIAAGVGGLVNTAGNLFDKNHQAPSNPPAVLGSALLPHYDGKFWAVITEQHVDNKVLVNGRYGWPQNTLKAVTLPSSGFIQTKNSNVRGDGTVPLWAIQEINSILDNGLRIL